MVPEHRMDGSTVHHGGVGPDNPILYDDDYLWAHASLGYAKLRGNILSRNMWDCGEGYPLPDAPMRGRRGAGAEAGAKTIPILKA